MRTILVEKENIDPKACSYGFPWNHDSLCYNFRMPKTCITADKIGVIPDKEDIETLVIGCDLDDYSFIGDMTGLRQLYIYSGANIYSLDFIKKLNKLSQLYIADSHIGSLEPLVEMIKERKRLFDLESDINERLYIMMEGICIESDNKLDGKQLREPGLHITEVIVNQKSIGR